MDCSKPHKIVRAHITHDGRRNLKFEEYTCQESYRKKSRNALIQCSVGLRNLPVLTRVSKFLKLLGIWLSMVSEMLHLALRVSNSYRSVS